MKKSRHPDRHRDADDRARRLALWQLYLLRNNVIKLTYSFDKLSFEPGCRSSLLTLSKLTGDIFMQYKSLAAALVTALPLLASAQSNVTIYGVMDAAVSSEDSGAPSQGRHTVINSGNQSSSRFGFRGTEDLGNGLKALFNLESGVSIDTGVQDNAGLFQRRAVVGLQNDIGTLTVGREYSPIAAIAGASDILGQGFYGNNLSAFNPGRLTRRLANSVNVKTAPLSGFSIGAAYSASPVGQEPTDGATNNLKGASLEYANGPFYAGLAYHTLKHTPVAPAITGDDKEYAAGLAYKFGDFEFKGNYLAADLAGPNNKFEQYNLGAAYSLGQNKFFVNAQQNKLEAAKGKAFTVAYSYTLSKRTNVYASYAKMFNNDQAVFGLNAASTTLAAAAPGTDPSALSVGLRHTF
jgi:predicted porin